MIFFHFYVTFTNAQLGKNCNFTCFCKKKSKKIEAYLKYYGNLQILYKYFYRGGWKKKAAQNSIFRLMFLCLEFSAR